MTRELSTRTVHVCLSAALVVNAAWVGAIVGLVACAGLTWLR